MNVTYKKNLVTELQELDFRHDLVESHIRTRIPLLIRNVREARGFTQTQLAELSGTSQSVISRAEDLGYGKLTITTVLQIFKALDIATFVDGISFSEFLSRIEHSNLTNMNADWFTKESEQAKIGRWSNTDTDDEAGADYESNAFVVSTEVMCNKSPNTDSVYLIYRHSASSAKSADSQSLRDCTRASLSMDDTVNSLLSKQAISGSYYERSDEERLSYVNS